MADKILIADMIAETLHLSLHISDHEKALITAGLATEPHPDRMRTAKVLEAAARFLLLMEPYGAEISQMLSKAPRGKQKGS